MTPDRDLAENSADGLGLVAAPKIRNGVCSVAGDVEAAIAIGARNRVCPDRLRERVFVSQARGDGGLTYGPDEIVKH